MVILNIIIPKNYMNVLQFVVTSYETTMASHITLNQYGMYFVSKFNALKFNGKDIDYRECNGFKVSIRIILWSHY